MTCLEDFEQRVRIDADTGVSDREHRFLACPIGDWLHRDSTARVGEPGGVPHPVTDGIGEAGAIAANPKRPSGGLERTFQSIALDDAAMVLDYLAHQFRKVQPLATEFDSTARDSRDIHEVIDQLGGVLDLSIENVPRAVGLGFGQFTESVWRISSSERQFLTIRKSML